MIRSRVKNQNQVAAKNGVSNDIAILMADLLFLLKKAQINSMVERMKSTYQICVSIPV